MSGKVLINCKPVPSDIEDIIHVGFLWRDGNCFVMDNHRCAVWCWLQSIDRSQKYNILHIDRHLDSGHWPPEVWDRRSDQRPVHKLTIEEYLAVKTSGERDECPVFAWDNCLSAFVHFYSHCLNKLHVAFHSDELCPDGRPGYIYQPPECRPTKYIPCGQLPDREDLEYLFESDVTTRDHKWIVNVDVDYFFYPDSVRDSRRLFSSEYVADLFRGLGKQLNDGRIEVVTIALSPGNTGTWKKARAMCLEICGHFGIPLEETEIRP